jgi:hypothetical protein
MKPFLILLLFALPIQAVAEVRGAARAGIFVGTSSEAVGTLEVEARRGNWAFAPAYELIRGGYGLHAFHVDVRRLFPTARNTFWIGAGPTFVRSNAPSSDTTWNVDVGIAWRNGSAWQPFVAARYYTFRMPAFRDSIDGNGAVVSVGISRRIH